MIDDLFESTMDCQDCKGEGAFWYAKLGVWDECEICFGSGLILCGLSKLGPYPIRSYQMFKMN
jgi:hypothetical protein